MFKKNELRSEMVKRGLTIEALAKKIKISDSAMYRKMNGESDFFRNEILAIAKVLGLDNARMCQIFFA